MVAKSWLSELPNTPQLLYIYKKLPLKNTFHKNERLCSKKQIDALFANGSSKTERPIKLIYSFFESSESKPEIKAMFVVPKKSFKKAHDRNKLKRRMREAYRLQKADFYKSIEQNKRNLNIAFLYISSTQQPYDAIHTGINKLLNILTKESTAPPKTK